MKIYNTLSKQKEEFIPLEEGKVKMYVCGPTVYNFIHIGNARPMIVFDTVRKYMEHKGYEVNFVSNFTDVDDKIIAKAIEESPYTKPIAKTEGSEEAYSPVYFLEFADSALIMAVTVYYERTYKMEVVKSDVNFRVREALIRNNIEIPYPHVTVTHKDASLHQ